MDKEQLIEKYMNGQLTAQEQQVLNQLLESDAAFKEALCFQLEVREAVKAEERAVIKARFKALDQRNNSSSKTFWYVAASMLVLFGLAWALFYNPQPDLNSLYAENFEPYPNVIAPAVRDNGSVVDEAVAVAFRHYDSRHYEAAVTGFDVLYKENGEDYAFFYKSVSLMAMGRVQAAVTNLENHLWNEPENYETVAHWYLGLGYLQLEDKEKAVHHLKEVVISGKPLSRRAQDIIEKIN